MRRFVGYFADEGSASNFAQVMTDLHGEQYSIWKDPNKGATFAVLTERDLQEFLAERAMSSCLQRATNGAAQKKRGGSAIVELRGTVVLPGGGRKRTKGRTG